MNYFSIGTASPKVSARRTITCRETPVPHVVMRTSLNHINPNIRILNNSFHGLSSQWKAWILPDGYENIVFGTDGLQKFKMDIVKQIEQWAF